MKGSAVSVVVSSLLLALAACGGGAGAPASGGGAVGGGGGTPPPTTPFVPPPSAPPPTAPAPVMLEGPMFGILNATDQGIAYFAWWEPRDLIDGRMPGMHWHWCIPVGGPVPPGAVQLVHGYAPPIGPADVVAVLVDGTTHEARVLYAPPASALWRVE